MPRRPALSFRSALIAGTVAMAVPAIAQADRFAADPRLDNKADSYGVSSRQAAHKCVAAAEDAAKTARFTGVEVIGIKTVERKSDGYEIEGWIRVSGGGPEWRDNAPARGSFECEISRGKIVDLDFDEISGL